MKNKAIKIDDHFQQLYSKYMSKIFYSIWYKFFTVVSRSLAVIVMTGVMVPMFSSIVTSAADVISGVKSLRRTVRMADVGIEVRAGSPPSVALIVICKIRLYFYLVNHNLNNISTCRTNSSEGLYFRLFYSIELEFSASSNMNFRKTNLRNSSKQSLYNHRRH